ncbi:hypothetical protein NEOLEDRAFT_1139745 [Neolentinus lepideus HHB14362 ss-1]|uniref:Uncharacterized protein n=1 Tax=Neolentinus lepideus HHB14362 ss-1 TaxID=1314782 RepID=A0A165PJK3_9AGAM|nr:hypothetical protein NEOLEDRAFT_1139745 [Neolentinus lepideus HHB14362 ss-1]
MQHLQPSCAYICLCSVHLLIASDLGASFTDSLRHGYFLAVAYSLDYSAYSPDVPAGMVQY